MIHNWLLMCKGNKQVSGVEHVFLTSGLSQARPPFFLTIYYAAPPAGREMIWFMIIMIIMISEKPAVTCYHVFFSVCMVIHSFTTFALCFGPTLHLMWMSWRLIKKTNWVHSTDLEILLWCFLNICLMNLVIAGFRYALSWPDVITVSAGYVMEKSRYIYKTTDPFNLSVPL